MRPSADNTDGRFIWERIRFTMPLKIANRQGKPNGPQKH
jgi:hypothetical protein